MPPYLKNTRVQVVGWTNDVNGTEYAHDFRRRLLGWYDRKPDHTHNSSGRLITTSGDATSRLILGFDAP